ncbi:MAG: ComEC/Rec2 family competence protein, partial [Myxococcota bacterium]
ITRLDTVVISHPHPDHTGALDAVFAEMPVGTVRIPRLPHPDEDGYAALLARTRAARVIGTASRGDPLGSAAVPGDAARAGATLLHPRRGFDARGNVNDESLVLRVDFGARRFLFPVDAEAAAEAALSAEDVRADVLKVPHHGSRTSSTPAFVARVAPEVAVVPVGRGNRYGHPHAAALASYRGARVYRTDRDGTVTIRTDGRSLHVDTNPPEAWRLRSVEPPRAPPATAATADRSTR